MKGVKSRITNGLQVGSWINACDNSGAKIVKIVSVIGQKTVKGRNPNAKVADL